MSNERISAAAKFSAMVDRHRENCSAKDCVNWSCDGTKHRNFKGEKWGEGWERDG